MTMVSVCPASVFAVFATVNEMASMAVINPVNFVGFAFRTRAGAGEGVEVVEVWVCAITGVPAEASPRMATRAEVRRVFFKSIRYCGGSLSSQLGIMDFSLGCSITNAEKAYLARASAG